MTHDTISSLIEPIASKAAPSANRATFCGPVAQSMVMVKEDEAAINLCCCRPTLDSRMPPR